MASPAVVGVESGQCSGTAQKWLHRTTCTAFFVRIKGPLKTFVGGARPARRIRAQKGVQKLATQVEGVRRDITSASACSFLVGLVRLACPLRNCAEIRGPSLRGSLVVGQPVLGPLLRNPGMAHLVATTPSYPLPTEKHVFLSCTHFFVPCPLPTKKRVFIMHTFPCLLSPPGQKRFLFDLTYWNSSLVLYQYNHFFSLYSIFVCCKTLFFYWLRSNVASVCPNPPHPCLTFDSL